MSMIRATSLHYSAPGLASPENILGRADGDAHWLLEDRLFQECRPLWSVWYLFYFIFFWGGRYTERSPGSSMYRRRHARRHRIHDPSWGRECDAPSFARVRSQRGSPRIVVPPHSDRSPLGMFSHQITSHARRARFQVYILDDYGNAHDPVVYVWVGKDAADTDARIALTDKEVFLKEKRASQGSQLSLSVTVVRIDRKSVV